METRSTGPSLDPAGHGIRAEQVRENEKAEDQGVQRLGRVTVATLEDRITFLTYVPEKPCPSSVDT